jgi:hypothetical protein
MNQKQRQWAHKHVLEKYLRSKNNEIFEKIFTNKKNKYLLVST